MRTKTRNLYTSTLVALAAAAGLPMMAQATVVETIDLVAANGGPINSQSANPPATGQPANISVSVTPVSGATVKAVLFTGTVTKVASGTFFSEARIAMRLPGSATDILLQPIQLGSSTNTTESIIQWRALIPAGVVANAGAWSFRFYESFVDVTAGPDSQWTALSVSFDDSLTPAFTDLGTFNGGAANTLTQSGTLAANTVTWYKFTTGGTTSPNYIDINALSTLLSPTNNLAMALYNASTGVRVAHNDDWQVATNSLPGLAFHSVATGPRTYSPYTTTFTNQSGNLAAGSYLLAVYAGPSGTAYSATITQAQAGTANVAGFNVGVEQPYVAQAYAGPFRVNFNTVPVVNTPPTGAGSSTPATALDGGSVLLTVAVAPGTNPPSPAGSLQVIADTTNIGGAPGTQLYDDGPGGGHGDVTAGDNIFSLATTVTLGTSAGVKAVPFVVSDSIPRSTSGSFNVNVLNRPTAVDLGTLDGTNTPIVVNTTLAAGEVKWYKIALPVPASATQFYDFTTADSALAPTDDTEIAIYDNSGAMLFTNDDSGTGGTPNNYLSLLSFGQTSPARTYTTTLTGSVQTAAGGTAATLAAGTYYIAVCSFNAGFSTPFTVTTPGANAGPLKFTAATNTSLPTNPTGTFAATPSSVLEGFGQTTVLSVVTTPGTNPTSSAITVTADLTSLGGLPGTPLVEGPAGTFTLSYPVPVSVTAGAKTVPFTVSDPDLGGRSSNGNGTVTVLPVIDLGTLTSAGITNSAGTIAANGIAWYKVVLPAADANIFVDMTTVGTAFTPTSSDSEIGLYDSTGTLVASDDDFGGSLLSALSFGGTAIAGRTYTPFTTDCTGQTAGTLAAGTYYIAIGRYNVNFNPNFAVDSTGGATGAITVNLYNNTPSGPTACNVADIVSIGGLPPPDGLLTGDDFNAFINAFAASDTLADIVSIGGLPPPDGLVTGDDFNAFINAFATGCP